MKSKQVVHLGSWVVVQIYNESMVGHVAALSDKHFVMKTNDDYYNVYYSEVSQVLDKSQFDSIEQAQDWLQVCEAFTTDQNEFEV